MKACEIGISQSEIYDPSDLWIEFPFPPEYLDLLSVPPEATETSVQTEDVAERMGEKMGEKLSPNRQKIISAMRGNPGVTQVQLVELVGIAATNIEKNIRFLKEHGWIRRVGPDYGGHWEVLK